MQTMSLNEVVAASRAVGLMAPKPKLNGINVPKVVLDAAQLILEIEREAFLVIGGDTKKTSMSDIVTDALRFYVRIWMKRHGINSLEQIPDGGEERRAFIRQVGLTNLDRMRAKLLAPDAEDGSGDPQ